MTGVTTNAFFYLPNLVAMGIALGTALAALLLGDRPLRWAGLVMLGNAIFVYVLPSSSLQGLATKGVVSDLLHLLIFGAIVLSSKRTWSVLALGFSLAALSFTALFWIQMFGAYYTREKPSLDNVALFAALGMFWQYVLCAAVAGGVVAAVRRRGGQTDVAPKPAPRRSHTDRAIVKPIAMGGQR